MNSARIHTFTDMIRAIGAAISERDMPGFDLAESIVRDWLISEEERSALLALIDSAREATGELEEAA